MINMTTTKPRLGDHKKCPGKKGECKMVKGKCRKVKKRN